MSDYEKNLRNAVMNVICNAMNFPKTASVHILGQDMGPLGDKIIDALLPIIAATRTAALEEAADEVTNILRRAYGENTVEQRYFRNWHAEWLRARAAKVDPS